MIENFLSENNCIISNKIIKPNVTPPSPVSPYITFADPICKQICVENWGSDGEITYEQVAAVTDLGLVFNRNTQITRFDELQYFINLGSLSVIDDGRGMGTFEGCTNLTSIIIPNSISVIPNYAFVSNTGLTSITLPNSITSIGVSAFNYCSELISITVETLIPPSLGSNVFFGVTNLSHIYVPATSVDTYKTAAGWNVHASKISAIV